MPIESTVNLENKTVLVDFSTIRGGWLGKCPDECPFLSVEYGFDVGPRICTLGLGEEFSENFDLIIPGPKCPLSVKGVSNNHE